MIKLVQSPLQQVEEFIEEGKKGHIEMSLDEFGYFIYEVMLFNKINNISTYANDPIELPNQHLKNYQMNIGTEDLTQKIFHDLYIDINQHGVFNDDKRLYASVLLTENGIYIMKKYFESFPYHVIYRGHYIKINRKLTI